MENRMNAYPKEISASDRGDAFILENIRVIRGLNFES
jgi:hypothetical protein